jgi:sulfite reductase (NADPH) hemoprotein beta-component
MVVLDLLLQKLHLLVKVFCFNVAPGMYNMYLGGGFAGERLNRLYKESIDEAEILRLLNPIVKDYAVQRLQGEHFGDFCIRKNIV